MFLRLGGLRQARRRQREGSVARRRDEVGHWGDQVKPNLTFRWLPLTNGGCGLGSATAELGHFVTLKGQSVVISYDEMWRSTIALHTWPVRDALDRTFRRLAGTGLASHDVGFLCHVPSRLVHELGHLLPSTPTSVSTQVYFDPSRSTMSTPLMRRPDSSCRQGRFSDHATTKTTAAIRLLSIRLARMVRLGWWISTRA